MRKNLSAVLLGLLLSVWAPSGILETQAQDASFPGAEVDVLGVDKETEKASYSPGDVDPASETGRTAAIRDPIALRSATRLTTKPLTPDASKPPVKRPAAEDDSILSFNFLCYIYQKYRMQDVVD